MRRVSGPGRGARAYESSLPDIDRRTRAVPAGVVDNLLADSQQVTPRGAARRFHGSSCGARPRRGELVGRRSPGFRDATAGHATSKKSFFPRRRRSVADTAGRRPGLTSVILARAGSSNLNGGRLRESRGAGSAGKPAARISLRGPALLRRTPRSAEAGRGGAELRAAGAAAATAAVALTNEHARPTPDRKMTHAKRANNLRVFWQRRAERRRTAAEPPDDLAAGPPPPLRPV